MDNAAIELAAAALLAIVLIGLAGFYGWRQVRNLRNLARQTDLGAEDLGYHRRQAYRRLTGCALMTVLALMIAGSYALGLNRHFVELGRQHRVDGAALESAEQRFVNFYSFYWITAVGIVMGLITLAAIDLAAIRRYGVRHMRKIQADRRTMIEQEVASMRSQRNGHQ